MVDHQPDIPVSSQTALEALSLLTKKWQPVVIVTLHHHEPMGFNALLESMPGVSGKVLSETLETLGENGLVKRTVVSESPLRVEYELTTAGAEMEPVFDALGAWGERHLAATSPTVVVTDSDRRLTEMYQQWLADHFTVRRAHTSDELEAVLDGNTDVLICDEDVPGTSISTLLESVPATCRTIVLVSDRPTFEILEYDCDALYRKPVVRETVLDAINEQVRRQGESALARERGSLLAKQALLEDAYTGVRLDEVDAYTALCERVEALEAKTAD
ncbi:winged helix-turn-helix transcriptional regulator [Natronosalvus vescus]|uniref:winged helix-turn-helix transcriptional regulator n=1 Tax=Natronosalvus vescus TaxID=2953881 RepID=UPI002091CC13|nr:winged helix-turn-helix transcriptional regulator [Natronosalvus vescus]